MPRKDKTTQDPRTYVELSDGKPLMVAIPKFNLELLAIDEGSVTALSNRLGIDRASLSQWISGQREMPNNKILYVADVMDVSPLWLLDLARTSDAREAPEALSGRVKMLSDLAAIPELEAGRDVVGYRYLITKKGHDGAAQALRDSLLTQLGDYRDLGKLAQDAAIYYQECTRPDLMLQQIHDVGHPYRPIRP